MVNAETLAQLFKQACLDELSALKPGNVHVFADGHGMVVQDFIRSAEAAAQVIAHPSDSVGLRILNAVNATWDAVGCNTNLGIILLAAPVMQASLQHATQCSAESFQSILHQTLQSLTVTDAQYAYQAIVRANPAGLGTTPQHDVKQAPTITLLQAMQAAQPRDLIAQQYANGYQEIFAFGLPIFQQALSQWSRPAWAATAVYLAYLSHFNDSHIVRKLGESIAQRVSEQAKAHYDQFIAMENPKLYLKPLLDFDKALKADGINPGTSADLTVTTLLIHALTDTT